MKNNTASQRTMAALRKDGMICGTVEKYNSFIKIRQDLFNFIDIIAISPKGIIGVQCTTGKNHNAHKIKILENKIAPEWLKAGGKIQLWSWSKIKVKRGGKATRWTARIEDLSTDSYCN